MIRRFLFSRAYLWAVLAAVVCAGATRLAEAQAQKQPEQPAVPTLKGTVSEVKKKGPQTILVIVSELGGDPFEVPLSPMMQFAVEAKGDLGFVRECPIERKAPLLGQDVNLDPNLLPLLTHGLADPGEVNEAPKNSGGLDPETPLAVRTQPVTVTVLLGQANAEIGRAHV